MRTPAGVTVGHPRGSTEPIGDGIGGGGGDGESSSSTCRPICLLTLR